MDDLVFEGRNQAYGAYQIRRMYDRNMSRGMISGILLFLLAFTIPQMIGLLKEIFPQEITAPHAKVVFLPEPPAREVAKIKEKPTQPNATPPVRKQLQYVAPVVRIDEDVIDEKLPPTNAELSSNVISTVTDEDDLTGIDVSLIESDLPVGDIVPTEITEDKIFNYVEVMPSFPNGQEAMYNFIYKHIKYPAIARDNRIEGNVIIQFVVSREGEIINAKIVRSLGGGIDQEALRVINSMPRWNPGRHNGRAVPVTFTLPIKFELID